MLAPGGSDATRFDAHRILLTGASGTLGYHILDQLASRRGVTVLALKRNRSKIRNPHPFLEVQNVDFGNAAMLRRCVTDFRPTAVIHCAATKTHFDRRRWFEMIRFNVDVSLRLCESVSHVAGCHFIYVSSGLAYRDQGRRLCESDALDTRHPYGASKAAADLLIRAAAAEFDVPLTVLRPFSFTGIADEHKRLFPSLLRAAKTREPMPLAPGDQVRDFCAAQDIAEAIVSACWSPASEGGLRVFNLGGGTTEPLRALIERVVDELALDVDLRFGARPYLPFEPRFLSADASLAARDLGWQPRTRVAYAVWQLAQVDFPELVLCKPPSEP
jgi:UDP-glucose 4-epimerase